MLKKLRHGGLLELTKIPEWSDFFRAALLCNGLKFKWGQDGEHWSCATYDFVSDLSRPIQIIVLSEAVAADKFDALKLALSKCGRDIKPAVWKAFRAFRSAVEGTAENIEDLL